MLFSCAAAGRQGLALPQTAGAPAVPVHRGRPGAKGPRQICPPKAPGSFWGGAAGGGGKPRRGQPTGGMPPAAGPLPSCAAEKAAGIHLLAAQRGPAAAHRPPACGQGAGGGGPPLFGAAGGEKTAAGPKGLPLQVLFNRLAAYHRFCGSTGLGLAVMVMGLISSSGRSRRAITTKRCRSLWP